MKNNFMLLVFISLPLLLVACSDQSVREAGVGGQGGGLVTSGLGGPAQAPGFNDPNSPLSRRVIYFDYESSNIKPEFVEVLRAQARYIATTPKAKVTLEGHTDERGTREFNLALAEDRANAVRRFLRAEGAAESQVGIVSFGEEKPAQRGQGEQFWALNRRVELVY